jgi:hypothetical protein
MLLMLALLVPSRSLQPVLQEATQQLLALPHSPPVEVHVSPALLVTHVPAVLLTRLLARELALHKLVHLVRLSVLHTRRALLAATW